MDEIWLASADFRTRIRLGSSEGALDEWEASELVMDGFFDLTAEGFKFCYLEPETKDRCLIFLEADKLTQKRIGEMNQELFFIPQKRLPGLCITTYGRMAMTTECSFLRYMAPVFKEAGEAPRILLELGYKLLSKGELLGEYLLEVEIHCFGEPKDRRDQMALFEELEAAKIR